MNSIICLPASRLCSGVIPSIAVPSLIKDTMNLICFLLESERRRSPLQPSDERVTAEIDIYTLALAFAGGPVELSQPKGTGQSPSRFAAPRIDTPIAI
jgi:hypothetical protein